MEGSKALRTLSPETLRGGDATMNLVEHTLVWPEMPQTGNVVG
jgi:hypothetical protein